MVRLKTRWFKKLYLTVTLIGPVQVESLSGGKSMESVKSIATNSSEIHPGVDEERWYALTIQIFIPFMIAGVGTIGAGIVLGEVEVSSQMLLIVPDEQENISEARSVPRCERVIHISTCHSRSQRKSRYVPGV